MSVRKEKIETRIILGLVIAQAALILGSWLYSAAVPESSVRAILSDSGIRWFFGTFVANLSSPLLVWVILLDIALGACRESGLWGAAADALHLRADGRERSGIWAAVVIVAIEAVVVLLLILPRHAILLSATGDLFPSSFSVSIVPIIAMMLLSASVVYGLFSGAVHNYKDVIIACTVGGRNLKFILAVYVLAMELVKMGEYVMVL